MDHLYQMTPNAIRGVILTMPEEALTLSRPSAVLDASDGFVPVIDSRATEPRSVQVEHVYKEKVGIDGILRAEYYVTVGHAPVLHEIILYYVDEASARAAFDGRYRGRGTAKLVGDHPGVAIHTVTFDATAYTLENKIVLVVRIP